MKIFPFSFDREPGTWRPAHVINKKQNALVICPDCGHTISLQNHAISAKGDVSPSLQCPSHCGYQELIHLQGWVP